tara:strand:- start:154 stop:879 length:726 start_codon:yes stop_codon:yes gene_type:complete
MPSTKSSSKSKATKQTASEEAAAVIEPVPPTKETKETKETKGTKEAKETKSTKKTTKKTEAKSIETTQVIAPETIVPEIENVVVATDSTVAINHGFTEFISKFQAMLSQFSTLRTELKTLERHTIKQLKVVEKLNNKKKRGAKRKPSGFVKPSPISDELAIFLGKEKGVEMARTDVTREINQYIRTHNLQDKENGRKINPDKALQTLLKITPESEIVLTYFNLQRYMGPHFPKSIKSETTA